MTAADERGAEEALEDYPDGVWLAELAPLHNPACVAGIRAAVAALPGVAPSKFAKNSG